MRLRAAFAAALVVAAGLALAPACGARTGLPLFGRCTAGETRPCGDGCAEVCLEDGSYGECVCPVDAGTVCFEESYAAKGSPVSLHFIVDRSGSMQVFWDAATQALSSFFADPKSGGLTVALDFFPPPGADEIEQCDVEAYRNPDVPFGRLTDAANDPHERALVDQVAATFPEGGTPMLPAYEGAIEAASARGTSAGPNEVVVVVLVTDGEPTGCNSTNSKIQIVALASSAVADTPSVRTFSIGLEGADQVLVDAVAERGQGESFSIGEDDVVGALVESFERIRTRLSCDFQLVGVPAITPGEVEVTFTLGGSDEALAHDPGCTRGGWTLDTESAPFRVTLCEDLCARVRTSETGTLKVSAGCAQVTVPDAGGTGGAGGSGGSDGGATSDALGDACLLDSQCGPGLFCLLTSSGAVEGGGPADGLCTAKCAEHADCEAIDALSRCEALDRAGGSRHCVEICQAGPIGLDVFNPKKCHGRHEVACSPLGDNLVKTVCLPNCNDDADCGPGLFCHPNDGLCRTFPRGGLPLGSACGGPGGGECRGECVPLAAANGGASFTCVEWCTNDALPACGWSGPGTGVAPGACLLTFLPIFQQGGPGAGDLGICVQLCDTQSDCRNQELVCSPIDNAQFVAATGRSGVCSELQQGVMVPPG